MRTRGFTLLEAAISLALMSMLALGVWTFSKNILSFNTTAYDSLSAQADLIKVMNVWTGDIRATAPAETGAYPIVTAATTTFTFYSDYDDDGVVERIRYFLSGTKIRKGVIEPTGSPFTYNPAAEVLSDQVRDVTVSASGIFQYYDNTYTGASTSTPLVQPVNVSAVRLVKVTVTVDRDPRRPPSAIDVTTQVSLRNLKDNL